MTVHKLTAGDGYTYLTRQVAANDATNRGYDNLGAYYDEKGEATRPAPECRTGAVGTDRPQSARATGGARVVRGGARCR